MQNLQIIKGAQKQSGSSVLTIGNFDGVHRGHQALFSVAMELSKKYQVPAGVFTFRPHPAQILRPDLPFLRIFSYEDQRSAIENFGFQFLVEEAFTSDLSQLGAEDFFNHYILKNFSPRAIVVGYDFGFGSHRQGSIEVLKQLCEKNKIELVVVPAVQVDGQTVSSTLIRQCLGQGNVRQAEVFLGRKFYLQGLVIHGDQRGRTIGVPTANMRPQGVVIPQFGVYISDCLVQGKYYPSITNVGVKPTFQSDPLPIVETHIFDFDKDIYDQQIQVRFYDFIRVEKRFSSIQELLVVMKQDIDRARKFHGI